MAVAFNEVPADLNIPIIAVEFDSSQAGATGTPFRSLVIGQRLSAGTVAAETPFLVSSDAAAEAGAGRGSQLALMVAAFRRAARFAELWAVGLDDASGATQQETTVTVTGTATEAGTIALYVAGRRVPVAIDDGDTASESATKINAAVAARSNLPMSSAVAAGVATLTARNAGTLDLDVRDSYQPGEVVPAGLTLVIATSTAGATDPDIADAIAAVAGEQFNVIVMPYNADAQMDALETELDTRWGPLSSIDGKAVVAFRGTLAEATTYGNARNSLQTSVMPISDSPTSEWEVAALYGGAVAPSAQRDPAQPFQTLPLPGALPPVTRWDPTERNILLTDGMSTHTVDQGGVVRIERAITTYQFAPGTIPDDAYMDLNTPLTLSFLRANFRNRIRRKYPRFKLADDGTRFAPGQPIMTPNTMRDEIIAWFRDMQDRGLVEDFRGFKEALIVERDRDDRNRLNASLPTNLVNQFRAAGVKIAFIL